MNAKIIPFKKPNGDEPHHRKNDVKNIPLTIQQLTLQEIFNDVTDNILSNWQTAAISNRLNEFIAGKLPLHTKGPEGSDYVNDLNVLSSIEQKLGMKVASFCPGCMENNLYGWLVAFHRDKEIFTTPPNIVTEANARALNIVLYLSFELTIKSLNRT